MKHPNVALLEKMYSFFAAGNIAAGLEFCPEQCTFQVAGKSKIAGKFTRANFEQEYFKKIKDLSAGTYQLAVHDIMSTDLHATVLHSTKATRDGKTTELRSVHVWRFDNGKPIAWYEYPRDLYAFDTLWS